MDKQHGIHHHTTNYNIVKKLFLIYSHEAITDYVVMGPLANSFLCVPMIPDFYFCFIGKKFVNSNNYCSKILKGTKRIFIA